MKLQVIALEHGAPGTGAKRLGAWLARVAPARTRGQLTIALVSYAAMRRLNRRFRGVDAVTDVLSFPSGERPFLGEIAIAKWIAARQARLYGHPVGTEMRILALHGFLHLLGYDHDVDGGEMARLEARLYSEPPPKKYSLRPE